jgi:hypothetical protein
MTPTNGATNPVSTMDRLAAWAGPDLGVNPWHLVKVPGVELFYLANTVVYRGVAVIEGSRDPIEGAVALAQVRQRGVSDPWDLAALALHFLAKGGSPLRNASEAKDQPAGIAAKVAAPQLQGNVLEFWGRDQRGDSLLRHRVDLEAGTITSQSGAQLAAAGLDLVAEAQKLLAGTSVTRYPGAIDALVASCADPRAPAALNDVIRKHGNASAREWAAFQAAACHNDDTIAALVHALEKDSAASVRKNAADALGKLAASKARAALERAKRDPDVSVQGAADRALQKLP